MRFRYPAQLPAAHADPTLSGIVTSSGQVITSVSDIQGQLTNGAPVSPLMGCAPVSGRDSAFDIDKNLAVNAAVRLSRNRFVIQADDIGRDGGAKAQAVDET